MSIENDPHEPSPLSKKIKDFFLRVWEYLKIAWLELTVMAGFFIADMVSKALVAGLMNEGSSVEIIPYILSFKFQLNYDAAFGNSFLTDWMGVVGSRVAFSIFAVAASVVFFIMLVRGKGGHKLYRIAIAMLIAGAMGNCIDRMFLGYVRDFIDMQLFTLATGGWWVYIFNIADVALVVGVILIIIYFIFCFETEGRKARRDARRAARAAKKAEKLGIPLETNGIASDGDLSVAADIPDNGQPVEPTEVSSGDEGAAEEPTEQVKTDGEGDGGA